MVQCGSSHLVSSSSITTFGSLWTLHHVSFLFSTSLYFCFSLCEGSLFSNKTSQEEEAITRSFGKEPSVCILLLALSIILGKIVRTFKLKEAFFITNPIVLLGGGLQVLVETATGFLPAEFNLLGSW